MADTGIPGLGTVLAPAPATASSSATTLSTTTDAAATATKRAKAWKTRGYVTGKDIEQLITSKQAEGKRPDVGAFLERQLSKGIGVGAGAVNKFNEGAFQSRSSLMGNIPYGTPSPNIGGMRGLQMQRGQVYMGAARVGGEPTGSPAAYGLPMGASAVGGEYARMLRTKSEVKAPEVARGRPLPAAHHPNIKFSRPTSS